VVAWMVRWMVLWVVMVMGLGGVGWMVVKFAWPGGWLHGDGMDEHGTDRYEMEYIGSGWARKPVGYGY
jgi:hypothetical protein